MKKGVAGRCGGGTWAGQFQIQASARPVLTACCHPRECAAPEMEGGATECGRGAPWWAAGLGHPEAGPLSLRSRQGGDQALEQTQALNWDSVL